tara:strand:+ start:34 stop:963 length:930 start_codon:yes stop_codon:yes gene_type:complete
MFTVTAIAATMMISAGHCGGCSSDTASAAPTIAQTAAADGRFTTLVAAVDAAGLTETLNSKGSYTVFAPTDAAFKQLPDGTVETLLKPENKEALKGILLYHVVPGHFHATDVVKMPSLITANGQRLDVAMSDKGATIDNANILITDIETSNGIIHVIDAVVLPSSKTIPQTAKETGKFNTLLAAAEAAGLVKALSADGPITVFAPTDEAFAKLPAGTVETLLKPENKAMLAEVLTYHVVPGRIYSDAALKAGKAKTLQGSSASIKARDNGVFVNNSQVIAADLDTSNGVIHVIDTVMLPPSKTAEVGTN